MNYRFPCNIIISWEALLKVRTSCAKTALFLRLEILDAKLWQNALTLFVKYLFLLIECMGIHVHFLIHRVLVLLALAQAVHDARLCRR